MQCRTLGAGHPDTLGTMRELAFTLCQKGKCAEGVEIHREVLEKEKREAIDRLPPRIALGLGDDLLFASQRRDSRFEALVVHAKQQAARQKPD